MVLAPLQPPDDVQDVASVVVHARVEVWPLLMVAGEDANFIVGLVALPAVRRSSGGLAPSLEDALISVVGDRVRTKVLAAPGVSCATGSVTVLQPGTAVPCAMEVP